MSDPKTPSIDFQSQYKRVFETAECRTQTELAAVLHINQASVSDAKRRRIIPAGWCITLLEERKINPKWIRTGTGGKYLSLEYVKDTFYNVVCAAESNPLKESTLQDLFSEMVRRVLHAN